VLDARSPASLVVQALSRPFDEVIADRGYDDGQRGNRQEQGSSVRDRVLPPVKDVAQVQDAEESEDNQELPQEDAIGDAAQEPHDAISEEHPKQRLISWPERSGGDQGGSDERVHERLRLGLPEAR
jgi:hypothetical protein